LTSTEIEMHRTACIPSRECQSARSGFPSGLLAAWSLLCLLSACSPDRVLGTGDLPGGILDPGATKTPAGALAAYRGALVQFRQAFGGFDTRYGNDGSYIVTSGLLSDELQASSIGSPLDGFPGSWSYLVDARTLPEYADPSPEPQAPYRQTYSALQVTRAQARDAVGLLASYVPHSKALAGHLYAVTGYSEMLLGELFCSGIPLSTVDYSGDYTFEPGSSSEDVYGHAIALFDSALTAAADSERLVNLARVGKGRALLDLGRYAEAAQAVAAVPNGFQYLESYSDQGPTVFSWANFTYSSTGSPTSFGTVADLEGSAGLDYLSSGDPRTAAVASGMNQFGMPLYVPTKYTPTTPIVLADWVEARLIEAEAALQTGDVPTWLGTLNHLRETAITPALPDTTDPGTPSGRVDLLFRERAFWLFLTGHREGDMRRLIRQYGRTADSVYPHGSYSGAVGSYGTAVTAPIPAQERAYNPKFTGCQSRGA
jgi:tetratricopeptide (TPR) repeat protein